MTREEKQLLLKDLCARLLYGVMCTDLRHGDSKITVVDTKDGLVYYSDFDEYAEIEYYCKPYLRSMSSMTDKDWNIFDSLAREPMQTELFDWLNEHHFDYRGLIEKGIALEAPEGMYKN